jgi:hypothetical protein
VEVHLRAADWRAHRHDRDPQYNRTVLHVVLWGGTGRPERRADGHLLPTLELAGRLRSRPPELALRLGDVASLDAGAALGSLDELACLEGSEQALRLVDRAALERFFGKAATFEADLEIRSAGEVFYRALLVGLGYSANKQACAQLGELVPWEQVRWQAGRPDGEQRVRALLIGGAGLLPSQRGLPVAGGEPARLELAWRGLRAELGAAPLRGAVWRLAGVRPENHPARRLTGAAALLARWVACDPPSELLEQVLAQYRRPGGLGGLLRARSAADFWAWHYDFEAPTVGPRPWQIGRPRAAELVINALLPLGYAIGRADDRPELAAAALLAYRRLAAGPWNRVSRAMAAQLFGPDGRKLCRSAARQQGLLHLFKRWCWERRCEACPAGERRRGRVANA